jgi:hypothetical protein
VHFPVTSARASAAPCPVCARRRSPGWLTCAACWVKIPTWITHELVQARRRRREHPLNLLVWRRYRRLRRLALAAAGRFRGGA